MLLPSSISMLVCPASVSYSVSPTPAWQLKGKTGSVQVLSVTPRVGMGSHSTPNALNLAESPLKLRGNLVSAATSPPLPGMFQLPVSMGRMLVP